MTDRPPLPDPPPGPGYPVVLRLAGRPCLVVGGGAVAARRVRGLLAAGAHVTVVAPRVEPSIEESATGRELEVDLRPYEPGEAGGFFLVLTATGRSEVDAMVVADATSAGALVAGADRGGDTSVQLPAVRRVDRVTIAVSTGGSTPALSRWLADRVAAVVPEGVGTLVSLVEEAREALRSNDLPTDSLPWADILEDVISPLVAAGRTDEARARLLELCRPDGHPGQSTR